MRLRRQRQHPDPAGRGTRPLLAFPIALFALLPTQAVEAGELPRSGPPAPRVLLDFDAAGLPPAPVSLWTNRGDAGGRLLPGQSRGPTARMVAGRRAVCFADPRERLISTFRAPEGITGDGDFTIAIWAHNPEVGSDECLLQWAERGQSGRAAQVNYGTSRSSGAVTHWGVRDMGFEGGVPAAGSWHQIVVTHDGGEEAWERLYVDGELDAAERKTLDILPGQPIRLANAGGLRNFSGSLGVVRIYDESLGPDEVRALHEGRAPEGLSPLVHLDPRDLRFGAVSRWPNRGTAGGALVVESHAPRVVDFRGRRAVQFDGSQWLGADLERELPLAGDRSFTLSVLARSPTVSHGTATLLSWRSADGDIEWRFGFSQAPLEGAFRGPGGGMLDFAGRLPGDGDWHTITYVYDSATESESSLDLYVDGDLVNGTSFPAEVARAATLLLGAGVEASEGVVASLSASIARLRLFDAALGPREVRNLCGLFTARDASPAPDAELDSLRTTLGWKAGSARARSFDLYLGSDPEFIATATPESAVREAGTIYIEGISRESPRHGPIDLELGRTYYWRVDQRDRRDELIAPGEVWRFSAPGGRAVDPAPRDGRTNVDAGDLRLSWSAPLLGFMAWEEIYIGTDRERVRTSNEPLLRALGGERANVACPIPLEPGKTYYWRVDRRHGEGPVLRGDVWSFRTADARRDGDITFLLGADCHFGITDPVAGRNPPMVAGSIRATIDSMHAIVGVPWPEELEAGRVQTPRGLLMPGDLLDGGDRASASLYWKDFEASFGVDGEGLLDYPVYEGFGSRDGPVGSVVREGIRERNRHRRDLAMVSPNGLHYSWDWSDVHFVCLNLYCGSRGDEENRAFSRSWNDPEDSLEFLVEDLREQVGDSGRPVILYHHYGFDSFGAGWNWWTQKEREAYHEAIEGYNVVGILHGHSHAAAIYKWRGIDVYSGGATQRGAFRGDYMVFRIFGDRMVAAHRRADESWGVRASKRIRRGRSATGGRRGAGEQDG